MRTLIISTHDGCVAAWDLDTLAVAFAGALGVDFLAAAGIGAESETTEDLVQDGNKGEGRKKARCCSERLKCIT